MRVRGEHESPLYDGAAETIAALHAAGYLLGVATGKSQRGLRAMLETFDLAGHFVTLQTADDAPSKPHPGMVERAMAEAGATPDETVVVGDTSFDMEMAINAGARAIGVGWGYHEADELYRAGALTVIDGFAALSGVIEGMDQ
jgi:phosphoglycolate phosphatase